MNATSGKRPGYTTEIVVAVGYVLFACLAVFACFGWFAGWIAQSANRENPLAAGLPPATPSPHATPVSRTDATLLLQDDFSTDRNKWSGGGDEWAARTQNGKLHLESLIDDNYAYVSCNDCPYMKTPYFLQADFSTGTATDQGFGLMFGQSYTFRTFYLFRINIESKSYALFHHTRETWSLRAGGESQLIRSYPAANSLAILAGQDTVELYINEVLVDSYNESGASFRAGFFSFYVDSSGFELLVDDLVVREVQP